MNTKQLARLLWPIWAGAMIGLASIAANAASPSHDEAASIARHGMKKDGIPSCASCHGSNGEGQAAAGFPRLAGLPESYLERQITHYANGQRHNATMTPIAKLLSTQQRHALAAYYADLAPPDEPAQSSGEKVSPAIERLAHTGRWSHDLPGCTECHGAGGLGVGQSFPPLAGQSAAYIADQLHDWKNDKRPPGPLGLMSDVAHKLSDDEIQALATYFSNRPTSAGEKQ